METEKEQKRRLTYRDGWRRSTIGYKKEQLPKNNGLGRLSWMYHPLPFIGNQALRCGWYLLPVVMFILFVWMVAQLAQLS